MRDLTSSSTVLVALLCNSFAATLAQSCFFPDGSTATEDVPCASANADQGVACCNRNDICLSNKLCYGQSGDGRLSRGSCTDQNWKSPGCPQYCAEVHRAGGQIIVPVASPKSADNARPWCCGYGYNEKYRTCRNATEGSDNPFYVATGKVIFNRTSGSTSPNATVTATAKRTVTALPPLALSQGQAIALGTGVGIPLGLALVACLGFLWKEKRYNRDLKRHIDTFRERNFGSKPRGHNWPDHEVDPWDYVTPSRSLAEIGDGRPKAPHQLQSANVQEMYAGVK